MRYSTSKDFPPALASAFAWRTLGRSSGSTQFKNAAWLPANDAFSIPKIRKSSSDHRTLLLAMSYCQLPSLAIRWASARSASFSRTSPPPARARGWLMLSPREVRLPFRHLTHFLQRAMVYSQSHNDDNFGLLQHISLRKKQGATAFFGQNLHNLDKQAVTAAWDFSCRPAWRPNRCRLKLPYACCKDSAQSPLMLDSLF